MMSPRRFSRGPFLRRGCPQYQPLVVGSCRSSTIARALARAGSSYSANKLNDYKGLLIACGGEGGIRTPDTVTRMPHFECGAFNHSATSPGGCDRGQGGPSQSSRLLSKRERRNKRG